MPSGTLQVYTALAENAAPLPGVTVLVLNEAGTQIARLTTNDVGSAPELVLTAPDEAYSLDEANTTVRPYAVYQLRAEMTGFPDDRTGGGAGVCRASDGGTAAIFARCPHPARSGAGNDPRTPAVCRGRRQRPGPPSASAPMPAC